MAVRGIRGAITVETNTKDEIIAKTRQMLEEIIDLNSISHDDIASATFSVTGELDAEFPAVAAREMGWIYTPLFCTLEIPVKGSLGMCIRVLIHVNSDKRQDEMVHVYLGGAKKLRPDLGSKSSDKYYKSD